MIDPTRSPLRLRYVNRLDPVSDERFDVLSGARWVPRAITRHNLRDFLGTLVYLHAKRRKVPAMPAGVTVELTAREFARLLSSDLADAKEWVMLNLTPRLVPAKRAVTGSARLTR